LKSSEFNVNVTKLISGSALSSLIFFLVLPLLSRLYSPEAFGGYQQFLSYSAILSCLATFTYHSAIPIPQNRAESMQLVLISFLTVSLVCLLLFLAFVFSPVVLFKQLGLTGIVQGRFYLPLIVFFAGLVLIIEHIFIREKRFFLLSGGRIIRASVAQGGALMFATLTSSYLGLVLSYLLGMVLSSGIMFLMCRDVFKGISVSVRDTLRTMSKYKKFPLIDTPSMLMTTIANELPIIMLTLFHSDTYIGVYAVAFRLIKAPLSIFSTSFFEVYYQKCSELYFSSRNDMLSLFMKTTLKMTVVGLCFLGVVMIFADLISHLYLGDGWSETAVVMRIIAVWIVIECVYNSISASFLVTNKLEVLFSLNCSLLIFRGIVMFCYKETPVSMITSLAISSAGAYLVYFFCAYKVIKAVTDD